jgi:hypothetical protein
VFALDADVENTGGSTADFPGIFTCTVTGPVAANAGTLEVIDTVIGGWLAVTNTEDAVRGRVKDSPQTARRRRVDQLALRGGATLRAIRADLLDVDTHPELDGIESVVVLENNTDETDSQGLPPHSFEVVIDDGIIPSVDDDDIAQVIWDGAKPAGIPAVGSDSGEADAGDGLDSTVTVAFTRRTGRDVWVSLTLDTDDDFPADGADQVVEAILDKGATIGIGKDVIALQIRAAAFSVPGVVDVPDFAIGFSASPTLDDNLDVGLRERAIFDSSRIEVA